MEPKSKKYRPRGHPRDPRVPGSGFLTIFAAFLDSVLGPVAPKSEHFSRRDFHVFSGRCPEQNLGVFGSILEPILKTFSLFWGKCGNSVFLMTLLYIIPIFRVPGRAIRRPVGALFVECLQDPIFCDFVLFFGSPGLPFWSSGAHFWTPFC